MKVLSKSMGWMMILTVDAMLPLAKL